MACLISFVGIAIECTSRTVAQFITGRIIIYYRYGRNPRRATGDEALISTKSVGAVEVATP